MISRLFSIVRLYPTVVTLLLVTVLSAGAYVAWRWAERWTATARPLAPSGGLYFPFTILNDVPHFAQADPRWGESRLAGGATTVGAAVDPGTLNRFLQGNGGFTRQGWLYWEKAADFPPGVAEHIYEDDASHFLIDWNLLRSNPVIVRLRYPNGITHFVVIVGKRGHEYLIRDPGGRYQDGLYFLSEFGSPIEALRFYRQLEPPPEPGAAAAVPSLESLSQRP